MGSLTFSGGLTLNPIGGLDMFYARFLADGTKKMGGIFYDKLTASAIAPDGGIYLGGSFDFEADFDPSNGTAIRTAATNGTGNIFSVDGFLGRYEANGNYSYVRIFGGAGEDKTIELATDNLSQVYVLGEITGNAQVDRLPTKTSISGQNKDVALIKFNAVGKTIWTRSWGGVNDESASSLGISPTDGKLTVAGTYQLMADVAPELDTANYLQDANVSAIFVAQYSQSQIDQAQSTRIRSRDCGSIQSPKNGIMGAEPLPGAQAYQFYVYSGSTLVDSVESRGPWVRLSRIGTPLLYDRAYRIIVRIKINGVWSADGEYCPFNTLETDTPGAVKLRDFDCNRQNVLLSSYVIADEVLLADKYVFNFQPTNNPQNTIVHNNGKAKVMQLGALTLSPGLTYRVWINVQRDGVWSNAVDTCLIYMLPVPTPSTHLSSADCGGVGVEGSFITAVAVTNANLYTFYYYSDSLCTNLIDSILETTNYTWIGQGAMAGYVGNV